MPRTPKRKGTRDGDGDDGEAKRLKTMLNKIADEYVCPITMELPLHPVMAQDGKIYERSAIEELIERQGNALRSPMTNEPMGPQLLPATQVRNTIEQLVTSGTIDGDKARHWEKRVKDEQHVASWKKKAENGDSNAMYQLGNIFTGGLRFQKQDDVKGFEWYMKAADHDDYPPGMARAGYALMLGIGTAENVAEGMMFVGTAAGRGSPTAAYLFGSWYAKGGHGLTQNTDRAMKWLRKAISGSGEFAHMIGRRDRSRAMELLEELLGDGGSAASGSN